MQTRIKEVRKSLKLTQTEFGKRIGVKGNTITGYETGTRSPSDAIIISICREFNVNEEWLRTSKGSMFISKPLNHDWDEPSHTAPQVTSEKARAFFNLLLNSISESDLLLMYQIFRRSFPEIFRMNEQNRNQ